nr:MAG TPA: hypothetical protein [Bacteriophage sp.]
MKTFGIHPRVAIQTADLFSDPQQVYVDSREYLDAAYNTELKTTVNSEDKDLQSNPQGDNPATVTDDQNMQMSFVNSG